MTIDHKKLNPVYVPRIRFLPKVKNEYFYEVPNATGYALSDYGRLVHRDDGGRWREIPKQYSPSVYMDCYPIQFDDSDTPELVTVTNLIARTFFPEMRGIYIYNPKFRPHSKYRWAIYDLHVLQSKNELVEAILAKLEHRDPNYDSSRKGVCVINRPLLDKSYRRAVAQHRRNMYSRTMLPGHPGYKGIAISDSFRHSDEPFGNWWLSNAYTHPCPLELDKDIMSYGNTTGYSLDTIALVPKYINLIFTTATSKLGYCITEVKRKNGNVVYRISYGAFKSCGYVSKYRSFSTYADALQAGRELKAELIRHVVATERAAGWMPEHILAAMEKWADLCVQGKIPMWEPSDNIKREKGVIV